jgi:hypothetical protein
MRKQVGIERGAQETVTAVFAINFFDELICSSARRAKKGKQYTNT